MGSQENGGVLDESQTFGGTWEYLPPDFVDAFSFRKFAKAHPEAPHKYWRPKAMDVWAAGILLYSAMTGRIPPWEMANWSQDLEFYHFEKSGGHYFDHLVNEGVLDQNELRMLNRMLNANPLRRITAPQILQDPWFQSLQNTCPPLIVEEVLSAETV